jgi:hypothetical protein
MRGSFGSPFFLERTMSFTMVRHPESGELAAATSAKLRAGWIPYDPDAAPAPAAPVEAPPAPEAPKQKRKFRNYSSGDVIVPSTDE